MPLTDFSGKTAVITGGGAGIGLELARQLTAQGAKVVLIDWEKAPLEAAAQELVAPAFLGDIRDAAGMQALAAQIVEQHGPVSLLCANAGVVRMAGVMDLTPQDWRWMFDVNVFGTVNTVQAFLPALHANPDGGCVLITGSLSSLVATRGQAGYAASKHALAAFGETLSMELAAEGAKVGVSILCPGPVRTNFGQSERNRGPEYGPPAGRGADAHVASFMDSVGEGDWSTPAQIAAKALAGVKRGDLWIVTHPQLMNQVDDRVRAWAEATDVARTLAGA